MFERLYDRLGNLPVAKAANNVAASVLEGKATILSAETGSGKTLYAAAKLADEAAKKTEPGKRPPRVLVLVPRRFLATNAAETVAELSGTRVGNQVGYALGRQQGEESRFSDDTQLLFATYGYALSSKIINSADIVVLDEVHENAMDIAITRAVLHDRLKRGEKVKVLEMSATIDEERQSAYWNDVAPTEIFNVEGKTYPCERRDVHYANVADAVIEMLGKGKKGILVFRPGMAEIKDTMNSVYVAAKEELRIVSQDAKQKVIDKARQENRRASDREIQDAVNKAREATGLIDLEIDQIYGEMSGAERRQAIKPPTGRNAKVLIGSNVIESGANIPWVDGGVSCGTGKERNTINRSNIESLDLMLLPQWRLVQQEGRVKRFKPGAFTLVSPVKWSERPVETQSELERLPLTDVLLQCVRFHRSPETLKFDPPLASSKVAEAKIELLKLGLVDSKFTLTDAGKFAATLPVSAQSAAMLWHAKQIGVLKAALPLAAVMDAEGIRADQRKPHGLDNTSDLIDGMKAFLETAKNPNDDTMQHYNVHSKRYYSAHSTFENLVKSIYSHLDASQRDTASISEIRQCIFAGRTNQFFTVDPEGALKSFTDKTYYPAGHFSTVRNPGIKKYAVAKLQNRPGMQKALRPVAEDITLLDLQDILDVAAVRPEILTVVRHKSNLSMKANTETNKLDFLLFGQRPEIGNHWLKEIVPDTQEKTIAAPTPQVQPTQAPTQNTGRVRFKRGTHRNPVIPTENISMHDVYHKLDRIPSKENDLIDTSYLYSEIKLPQLRPITPAVVEELFPASMPVTAHQHQQEVDSHTPLAQPAIVPENIQESTPTVPELPILAPEPLVSPSLSVETQNLAVGTAAMIAAAAISVPKSVDKETTPDKPEELLVEKYVERVAAAPQAPEKQKQKPITLRPNPSKAVQMDITLSTQYDDYLAYISSFGFLLKERREERDMSREELAVNASDMLAAREKISSVDIKLWEQARELPTDNQFEALATILIDENERIVDKAIERQAFRSAYEKSLAAKKTPAALEDDIYMFANKLSDLREKMVAESVSLTRDKLASTIEGKAGIPEDELRLLHEHKGNFIAGIEAGVIDPSKNLILALVKALDEAQPLSENQKKELYEAYNKGKSDINAHSQDAGYSERKSLQVEKIAGQRL